MSIVAPLLSPESWHYMMNLPIPNGQLQAKYIWIDGTGEFLRSKSRTIDKSPSSTSELPVWNFDGSSTGQASGHNSDVYMKPVAIYKDPWRRDNNILVMTDCYDYQNNPLPTNKRVSCAAVMDRIKEHKAWFGIEQEYQIMEPDQHSLAWPKNGFPAPQGPYNCSVGADRAFGRAVMDAHYRCCLYAGIKIAGSNAEVTPAQWEYQVGPFGSTPCEGLEMSDMLWTSRYILHRVAEDFGLWISLDPKPFNGDWNGAGGHCNFSTEKMRAPGGLKLMEDAMQKLSKNHWRHIQVYDPKGGEDNKRRLTGRHETSAYSDFTWGVADRGASVRIPRQCHSAGCGYIEDRRPSSNCDPYLVTEALARTVILDEYDW